jgi:hypothetical protein
MAQLTLTWSPPADCNGCTYEYRYKLSSASTYVTGATSNTIVTINNLIDAETYNYSVRTICPDAGGNLRSRWLNGSSVTCNTNPPLQPTPTPTITPTPTSTSTPTPTPTATANSVSITADSYQGTISSCAATADTPVFYVGTLGDGTTLYTTSSLTPTFDGDGDWYKIGSSNVGRISGLGVISQYQVCSTPTPTPTPTATVIGPTATPTATPTPTPTSVPLNRFYIASPVADIDETYCVTPGYVLTGALWSYATTISGLMGETVYLDEYGDDIFIGVAGYKYGISLTAGINTFTDGSSNYELIQIDQYGSVWNVLSPNCGTSGGGGDAEQ